ncbi:P-II family nitrogen regulator [Maritalea sp.]|jgi:nitrogen regulatory protein PII|uniref:P-II family nitrogen regulator n=1 Tax=Maritalea sp. TaxID=2003361 RepID=UPI0039E68FE1
MKLIIAIIKPHKLDEVRDAIGALDILGMTVTEVRGYGRQRGHTEIYRGAEYEISYVPKLKLEIGVPDDKLDQAVDAIREAASEGKIGDGKIFVLDLEAAIRVRTGENGESAL